MEQRKLSKIQINKPTETFLILAYMIGGCIEVLTKWPHSSFAGFLCGLIVPVCVVASLRRWLENWYYNNNDDDDEDYDPLLPFVGPKNKMTIV